MISKGRTVAAVAAGMVLWFLLWNSGTRGAQALFPTWVQPEMPITHVGILWSFIGYSVLVSVLAGWLTAVVARGVMRPVWILAFIHLAIGIAVEISYWSMMPAWYHIVFLALVVPATLIGGRLRASARPAEAVAT